MHVLLGVMDYRAMFLSKACIFDNIYNIKHEKLYEGKKYDKFQKSELTK